MKHVLLVGRPGIGKTTLIKDLAHELRGGPVDGFYTEELREHGQCLGFWLSSLDGRQALLAHRDAIASDHQVGPYRVNLGVMDQLGVAILTRAMRQSLIVLIDELGPMELGSMAFQAAVEEAFVHGLRVIATAGLEPLPFIEALKRRKDVELVPLSAHTRQAVFDELSARLQALCDEDEHVHELQRQADRICEMIVMEEASSIDIEIQQAKLRELVARLFPDKQNLYYLLYESRFRRLWEQFREGQRWDNP